MIIKEISKDIFDEFAKNHLLYNQYQTSNYATIKQKQEYEIVYIGGYKNNILVCASMILFKQIAPTIKYGYAPRGFLIDYYDKNLMQEFTKALKSYYLLKNIAFIKIDPEIIYSVVDPIKNTKKINSVSDKLISFMSSLGYQKLKSSLYFDSMMPVYNPIIDLSEFRLTNLNESVITEIKKSDLFGLKFRKGTEKDIETLFSFVKDKKNRTQAYYSEYYNSYNKTNNIDLFVLEIDYSVYLKILQKNYEEETLKNEIINKDFLLNSTDTNLFTKKMDSDKTLSDIKNEITEVTKVVRDNNYIPVASALVTKFNKRVTININGWNKNFAYLNSKLYLFYNIIYHYKREKYDFIDMDGITADFTENNPYKSLNDFKLKFNPTIYEYIGEFDLVINPAYYQMLWTSGKLHKEFQKERVSD